MNQNDRLQEIQNYIRPSNNIYLMLIGVFVFFLIFPALSGEEVPSFIWVVLLVCSVSIVGFQIHDRGKVDEAITEAANQYGLETLIRDFRSANPCSGDQVRLGKILLYSSHSHCLVDYKDIRDLQIQKAEDSDGNPYDALFCYRYSGMSFLLTDRELNSTRSAILQRIAAVKPADDPTRPLGN